MLRAGKKYLAIFGAIALHGPALLGMCCITSPFLLKFCKWGWERAGGESAWVIRTKKRGSFPLNSRQFLADMM